jgi:hypothetical protein
MRLGNTFRFANLSARLIAGSFLMISLAGCRQDQLGAGTDSGTIASDLIIGIVGFAVDFVRSLLAAFLF